MLSVVTYSAAVPEHLKKTVGKPDENGYYDIVLGAFNIPNTSGVIYRFKAAKKWFESNSLVMKRIRDGQLRSEAGHPQRRPGEKLQDFIARLPQIERARVCAHIKEVRLEAPEGDDGPVTVYGKVKPAGPFGPYLKESFENPDENVAFSVRSIVRDVMIGGQLYKDIVTLITWDWVNEPGIKKANKWQSLGIENDNCVVVDEVEELHFTEEDVKEVLKNQEGLGNEAHEYLVDLANSLGINSNEEPFFKRW